MKSQRKRTREKKQRQVDMSADDTFFISGSSDVTLDITNQGAACSTLSIDDLVCDSIDISGITMNTGNIYTTDTASSYIINTGNMGYSYNDTTSYTFSSSYDPKVNIDADGVQIKGEGDLKIGDRSMKDFMDKVEDQLAILRPAPELEEKWDKLRELRRQYEECRQDILEKEKIMEILKRD
jgi:hypothetical protein